jgi:F-type H+-transporting ATPase subunit delta
MAELTVDNIYALALFEAADEADHTEQVYEDSQELLKIMSEHDDLKVLLGSPAISAEEKKTVFREMFEENMAEELLNFLMILIDKRRITHLEGMMRAYEKIYSHTEGVVDGVVYSVKPLSDEQLASFEKQTGKLIGETVKLSNQIDDSLIAGVKILVDGKLIDASYRNQLNKIAFEIRR